MRFSSKSKLFLTAGRVSHSLQLPPELGAGCYIEKNRQGLVWAAVTVCSGVALLGALQMLEYWIWQGSPPEGAHTPSGSPSATLPLCHCPKEQSCLQLGAGCCCCFPHAPMQGIHLLENWPKQNPNLKYGIQHEQFPVLLVLTPAKSWAGCSMQIFNWHKMILNL